MDSILKLPNLFLNKKKILKISYLDSYEVLINYKQLLFKLKS